MKLFMLYGLTLVLLVHGQDQSGFKSIDCGISEGSDYKDEDTTISYTSDAGYIDTGTNLNISSDYIHPDFYRRLITLRSFPDGIKNCYTIHLAQAGGDKYLIRASFKYGNYDSKNQPPEFALYVDGDQWHTITFKDYPSDDFVRVEIIHNIPATTAYINVCLVNTGHGTPFISVLELRQLNNSIYQTKSGSLKLFNRIDVGSTTNKTIRYTDDVYDRIWLPDTVDQVASSAWEVFSASHDKSDTLSSNDYKPPYRVMATAVRPVNGSNSLNFSVDLDNPTQQLYVYMHFAEIETIAADQKREFDIYINDDPRILNVTTDFLQPTTIISTYVMDADLRQMNFSIRATKESTLPPILNAIEVYEVLELTSPTPTTESEVDAIRNVKSVYGGKRNWQGDPCVPRWNSWEDLQCNYDGNSTRIISLNLSSSSLSGNMDSSFSGLTSLESLDLSNNNLTGPVPDFLSELPSLKTLNLSRNNFIGSVPPALIEKSKIGSLTLSIDGNRDLCQSDSCEQMKKKKKNRNTIAIIVASVVPSIILLSAIAILWSLKRRRRTEGRTLKLKNRRFTYSEVVTITNNFQRVIGKGGFGTVYLGNLEDGTEVAVKMLSQPLSQGSEQFWTEAELLTTVHHRNVASLIGYCDQGSNTALLYEYMANGNLKECLLGLGEEEDEEVEQTLVTKKAKKSSTPASKATIGKDQPSKASKTAIANRTRASASKSPKEGSPPTVAKSKSSSKGMKAIVAKTTKLQELDEGDSSDPSGGSEPNSPASGEVKTTSFSLGMPKTQSSAEKKPILLDLDDESFDKFFQTVEELIKPTASGASDSEIGSSTTSSFAPDEIIQAKEVLKAALSLGIDSVFHQDHYSSVRKSMNILVKSQALAGNAEPALQSFLRDFPNLKRPYESATQKCVLANFKLTKIDDLQQELKQGFGARDQLKTEINEAKTKRTGLLTTIQTLETKLSEARQQLADHGQHEASLVQRRQELLDAAQGPLNALQTLMVEKPTAEASRDQAEVVINDAVIAWDSLKASLENEL